jgi:5-methylcytosine-specific restriction endonuclease McrA
MSKRTLLLNHFYFPQKIVSWQDAIALVYLHKVDVLVQYDEEIRSPSTSIRCPAVARLRGKVAKRQRAVKFSRLNVYLRDGFACSYCGEKLPLHKLTYDHVVPRARGGRTSWDNIVTACRACNSKKANRTPAEAGLALRQSPHRPQSLPLALPLIDLSTAPVEWREFLPAALLL